MKKIFFMAFLAFTMNANAQESNNVEATETDNEDTYCDADDEEDANDVSIHGFIGVNIPTNVPEGFDFAPFRSWEFDLTFAQYDYTPNDKKTTLSAGLGFGSTSTSPCLSSSVFPANSPFPQEQWSTGTSTIASKTAMR